MRPNILQNSDGLGYSYKEKELIIYESGYQWIFEISQMTVKV